MSFLKAPRKLIALAIFAAVSSTAMAQSAGDTVVSGGWFHIAPQDSSSPLSFTSPSAFTVAGSGADVENTDTFGLSVTHFYTNNWAASLDIGVPPTYKLNATGSISAVGQIGEAKQWAPTVLGKYFFNDARAAFRPFLGLGISHVSYKDISLTSSFQAGMDGILQPYGPTTTSASLSSSWAPVFNAGFSYALEKNWYASFSVSYVHLSTTADLTTQSAAGPILSNTEIKLNPFVTFAAIGYRF